MEQIFIQMKRIGALYIRFLSSEFMLFKLAISVNDLYRLFKLRNI
ncbi:hypothetical protein [Paenibacillus hunanensis]|uniref:Uncharacterized protein n=1 Tax=Paenibacillus hunanensis TaxID=539262 RepID=A0ABU1J064_9BACL|nr:hypothetical protein [Paenibacillus hunanensis]MDR6244900.1 hypothetical protein [Paenibacillus hunanensis]